MKLIENWRETLRAYSTWALGAVAAIPALWLQVPDEVKVINTGAGYGEAYGSDRRGRPDWSLCRSDRDFQRGRVRIGGFFTPPL
jgi:hypothetical protein